MPRRSNSQIPSFHFAILFAIFFAIFFLLLCLTTPPRRTFPFPSPTPNPSPAQTNNTVTLPPASLTISDSPIFFCLAHNSPITTQELYRYISRLSELLASGVIDSDTLTLSTNNP